MATAFFCLVIIERRRSLTVSSGAVALSLGGDSAVDCDTASSNSMGVGLTCSSDRRCFSHELTEMGKDRSKSLRLSERLLDADSPDKEEDDNRRGDGVASQGTGVGTASVTTK